MNSRNRPQSKTGLLAGAAVAAILIGGGVIHVLNRPGPASVEGQVASTGRGHDESHADGGGREEGVVDLTPAQLQAAAISLVGVSRGGGGETRLAGRVTPMIDARAVVGATLQGVVERVLVAPGQRVRAGQPLAVLLSGEAAALRADVDAAAAVAEAARQAHDRDQSLFEQGVVARQEVEASRAQALSAEAAARAAKARAQASGNPNASGRLNVTSPIPGVVTNVGVGPGGFVAQGAMVAEVTTPERIELVFNAPPAVATQVRSGSVMRVAGPAGEFDAVVTGVAVGAGADSGATVVRARPSTASPLPAGAIVSGVIVSGEGGALTVPSEAVQTVGGRTVVFVRTDRGFRAASVMAGRQASGRTEILRGLSGGERIAGANAFLLKAELAKGEAGHEH